ncbi:hypothetical protein AB4342_01270 [Vibrio breoganii]
MTSKNFIPQCTKSYLSPTSDTAKRFKESKMIGNAAQCYMALSRTLGEANEIMKRAGISRMARNCILVQYSDCINQPDMESDDFFFWTNQPASEQIRHSRDIEYPTEQLIEVLNDL